MRSLLLGGALVVAATSCDRGEALRERAGVDRALVVVLSPRHAPRDRDGLTELIARGSGLRVELRVTETAEEAVGLVERREADAGLLSLFDFLLCAELYDVVPLAQVVREGGRAAQEGEIFVRDDADARDLAALRGRTVAFVDRYSVTGFLLPANRLREAGVEVEPLWLGSHGAVREAVRQGRAVAGASYRGTAENDAGLRVLSTTPSIANEPLFAQPGLPAETRASLARALLELGQGARPGALEGVGGATGFREVPPGVYRDAVDRVRAAGRRVEDMVVDGWVRANEHRRPLWSYAP